MKVHTLTDGMWLSLTRQGCRHWQRDRYGFFGKWLCNPCIRERV